MKLSNFEKSISDIRQSQIEDEDVINDLLEMEKELTRESIEEAGDFAEGMIARAQSSVSEALEKLAAGTAPLGVPGTMEAIIERHNFPALLVQNGRYEEPRLPTWKKRLNPHRRTINRSLAKVGRIELVQGSRASMLATGWLIDEETIITNRHVASAFSDIRRAGHPITPGVTVRIDFLEEHGSSEAAEFGIDEVKFIDLEDADTDLAFLRLERSAARRLTIDPVPVKDSFNDVETVGVVGYSAFDSRNSTADQMRIFGGIFEVKRLSPGQIISDLGSRNAFQHNATTLGGNSGGLIMDVGTGCAVGLHFGGREGQANFAVKPKSILDRAARTSVRVTPCGGGSRGRVPASPGDDGAETPSGGAPSSYLDRDGFDPHFLGTGKLTVPFPKLNRMQEADAATVKGGGHVLNYRHFSVVMNKKRRIAYYSAVNIDGNELWAFKRGRDNWVIDSRIGEEDQVDNVLYEGRHNDFDRGHLVRRLDPVWDDKETATQAMEDTFHYTNAAPQHRKLNRSIWLRLEEHILDNTDEKDLKISVMAGPVFGPNDPVHKPTQLPVPRAFWKVIASIGRKGRRGGRILQVQAFLLPQDHLIDHNDLEALSGASSEAIFGNERFATSQVTVAELERVTGLDFQNLKEADTFGQMRDIDEISESARIAGTPAERHYAALEELGDIVM